MYPGVHNSADRIRSRQGVFRQTATKVNSRASHDFVDPNFRHPEALLRFESSAREAHAKANDDLCRIALPGDPAHYFLRETLLVAVQGIIRGQLAQPGTISSRALPGATRRLQGFAVDAPGRCARSKAFAVLKL